MTISAKRIIDLNERYHFLENLSERELKNPEGVGIDLRVGKVHHIDGPGFLGVSDRDTSTTSLVADVDQGDTQVVLQPGQTVLATTMETVHVPAEPVDLGDGNPILLMVDIYPRSTLHRCGVQFRASKTDPGYKGVLTFSLHNGSNHPFTLEMGARFSNIVYRRVYGNLARAYEGQWQGGRVSTRGREVQN